MNASACPSSDFWKLMNASAIPISGHSGQSDPWQDHRNRSCDYAGAMLGLCCKNTGGEIGEVGERGESMNARRTRTPRAWLCRQTTNSTHVESEHECRENTVTEGMAMRANHGQYSCRFRARMPREHVHRGHGYAGKPRTVLMTRPLRPETDRSK